ncbi:MAG: hypothetical protein PHV28_03890 [Kiritimatiellae bacterium]|nr:hypothetical protein [Kiritimatiellia bacterium]
MRKFWTYGAVFLLSGLAFSGQVQSFDFFKIQSVKFVDQPSRKGNILYQEAVRPDKTKERVFLPYLEVTVRIGERTRAETVYAKVYYYDRSGKLTERSDKPFPVARGSSKPYPMPVFFEKTKTETLYFAVPKKVVNSQGWKAVAVFGDKLAAAAAAYPSGLVAAYDFPERPQVDKPARVRREAATDPVIQYVVKTRSAKQPQITLLMRPPIGMTDISEADGVLAMCLLANSVDEIKRRLQVVEAKDDVGSVLRFAEKHKLVILCWGSRSLWDPRTNWDDQSKGVGKQMDETFDEVSAAWARGVEELSQKKYGMPEKGFLLWGVSGSAQYAQRLALRKPQYFLAVHVHIPSSFDKPTREASQVLWCLTTGENESGYERSLRFLSTCREMGYPIIYKAIPGLGHQGHPVAERLGLSFFEYALSLRDEKSAFEDARKGTYSGAKKAGGADHERPWPESFSSPACVGDVVNQEVLSFDKAAWIPSSFRIDLPTQTLADIWKLEK